MDEKTMGQKEFAMKYGEEMSTVSLAIGAAHLKSCGTTSGKYPRKLYLESDMAGALTALYRDRKMSHLQKAARWEGEAEAVEKIYREGGSKEDYINPINGRLDSVERAEKEMREMMK